MTEEKLKIKGIVEQISQKEGKYGVKVDGNWYNGFGDFDRNKGDEVEITYVKNKQWNNVDSFVLVTEATAESRAKEELPITSLRRHKLDCLLKSADAWIGGMIEKEEVIPFGQSLFNALDENLDYVEDANEMPEVEVVKV